jgi:hypothetical protein
MYEEEEEKKESMCLMNDGHIVYFYTCIAMHFDFIIIINMEIEKQI